MNSVDKWIKEVSSYIVAGGLAGLPIALLEFPLIYPAIR